MAALKACCVLALCVSAGTASAQLLTLTNTSRDANQIPLGYPVPLPVESLTPVAGFRSYAALEDRLAALALNDDVAATVVGETVRGRPITAYRIGDADAVTAEGFAESAALINGTIHAREWASPEVVTGLVERMVAQRNDAGFYRYLLDSTNLIVIPVLNVDGFLQTQRYPAQTLDSEYAPDRAQLNASLPPEYRNYPRDGRLRRKNMRDVDEILCPASQDGCIADGMLGVDLNRNNDSKFFDSGNQNSDDPAHLLYHGVSAGSEPEIQALYAAAELGPRNRLRLFSDTHSFGRVFFGADTGSARRNAITRTLAERMSAATNGNANRYPYDPTTPNYGIGSTDEYFGNADQIPAYTLEIEPTSGGSIEYGGFGYHHDGFILPAAQIARVRRELADAYSLGLYRMAGPPVLLAAQIRRVDNGELVYAAQWQRSGNARQLQLSAQQALLADTDYRLWLAFSKPMRARNEAGTVIAYTGQNATLAPQIAIEGESANGSPFSVALTTSDQGWLPAAGGAPDGYLRYVDDAYAVNFRLPASVPLDGAAPVELKVTAQDLSGQALDSNPATVLDWSAGWLRYEDDRDRDTDSGGSDRTLRIVDERSSDGGGGGGFSLSSLLALLCLVALRASRRAASMF